MNNNDEFILAPPSILTNTAGPNSARWKSRGNKSFAEFKIIQPDRTLHSFKLHKTALGNDCIDGVSAVHTYER